MEGSNSHVTQREQTSWRERLGGADIAVAIIVYLIVSTVLGLVLEGLGYSPTSAAGLPYAVVANALAMIVGVGVAVRFSERLTVDSLGLRPPEGRWLLVGAGLGLLAWLLSNVIGALYTWAVDNTTNPRPEITNAVEQGTLLQVSILFLAASLLVPFTEELLFRGVLYTYLRRWGVVVAVVFSALLFGLSHGINVISLTSAMLGVLAALAYEFSGSLWPAVLTHAVMNTALTVSSFLTF